MGISPAVETVLQCLLVRCNGRRWVCLGALWFVYPPGHDEKSGGRCLLDGGGGEGLCLLWGMFLVFIGL